MLTSARKEIDNPRSFHLASSLSKVPLGFKRPMQRTYYPVFKSLNICSDVLIDLGTPTRKVCSIVVETIDRLLAHLSNEVNGRLKVEAFFVHHNGNHIVGVAPSLFDVEREEVLIMINGESIQWYHRTTKRFIHLTMLPGHSWLR